MTCEAVLGWLPSCRRAGAESGRPGRSRACETAPWFQSSRIFLMSQLPFGTRPSSLPAPAPLPPRREACLTEDRPVETSLSFSVGGFSPAPEAAEPSGASAVASAAPSCLRVDKEQRAAGIQHCKSPVLSGRGTLAVPEMFKRMLCGVVTRRPARIYIQFSFRPGESASPALVQRGQDARPAVLSSATSASSYRGVTSNV